MYIRQLNMYVLRLRTSSATQNFHPDIGSSVKRLAWSATMVGFGISNSEALSSGKSLTAERRVSMPTHRVTGSVSFGESNVGFQRFRVFAFLEE
jgi:hypothetical protein